MKPKQLFLIKYQYCIMGSDNRPFEHSRFDSKIIHLFTFFMWVISLMMGKMVLGTARAMERKTNLSTIFS